MYSEVSPWLSSGYFELAKSLAVRGMPRLFLCPDLFTAVLCSQGAMHSNSEGFFAQLSSYVCTSDIYILCWVLIAFMASGKEYPHPALQSSQT